MTEPATPFDPFDPGQAHDAWPLLAQLRAEAPVVEIAGGMHYVTRHEECRDMLRATDALSNASGFKAPGVEIPLADRLLGELDPPLHTPVRRVMVTAMAPRLVRAAVPFIRETAHALLDEIGPGEVDLVAGFTVLLPNRVTVHLLGLPPEDADALAAWAKELMESPFPRTNATPRGVGFAAAFPEFAGYIDTKIDEAEAQLARGEQRDDVLARLTTLEIDGSALPRRQVRALVRNLITGGLTTTSQLLGNLLYEIFTVSGLEAAVRADEDALGRAVEESLRIAPPVLFVPRGCTRDTTVAGVEVHDGERVIAGTGCANRDERVFDEPDEFRVDRPNADQHLTFGYGPHVCPGASLARTVARVGIRAFLDHFPPGAVRLAETYTFENVPTFFEQGPRRLPVVLEP